MRRHFDTHHRFLPDGNNAIDGDVHIAWALLRTAELWGVPAYRARAERMGRDLLLPGAAGFSPPSSVSAPMPSFRPR